MPDRSPLPEFVADWDSNTTIRVRFEASVDAGGVFQDCELVDGDTVGLGLAWYSPGTTLRERGPFCALEPSTNRLEIALDLEIPGSLVASQVVVIASLFLATAAGGRRSNVAPSIPGSLLWSEERRTVLEGLGSRFPMELVDFSLVTWLPSGAAWFLDWDPAAPENLLLRSVRLFLNVSNAKVASAVRTQDVVSDEAAAIRSAIHYDVGRTLVLGMLESEDFVAGHREMARGTVGAHVLALLAMLFPGESIEALRSLARGRPALFDARLQERFRLFGGV